MVVAAEEASEAVTVAASEAATEAVSVEAGAGSLLPMDHLIPYSVRKSSYSN